MAACGQGPPEEMPVVDRRFRTTPPSRIYFKNMRSTAYQWEQDPESRTDFYLLRKIALASPRPVLYPVIADIWMEDQAQVLLKNKEGSAPPTPIVVRWSSAGGNSDSCRLDSLTAKQQYQLALEIYLALPAAREMEVSFGGQPLQALFAGPAERSAFAVSMQDYLRLTEYQQ